jgi:iron(III) transport system ATP-binding protein
MNSPSVDASAAHVGRAMMGAVSAPVVEPKQELSSSTPAVRVMGVKKRFGRVDALNGIDVEIGVGQIMAVLGPSGCGKSTLLASIAGLHEIDDGTIEIGSVTVAGSRTWVPPQDRRVGVVFQDHALFPHLTVEKNVMFGLTSLDRQARVTRTKEMLELVRLSRLADRYPNELSGGESQRVALARALAPKPVVLLLDEPFASLDPELRDDLRFEVATVLREAHVASMLVTHDHLDAMMVADRITVMRAGNVVQSGSAEDVFDRPLDEGVGRTFGALTAFPVDHSGNTELGVVPHHRVVQWSEGRVAVARPHDLIVRPWTTEPVPGSGAVVSTTFLGTCWRVVVSLHSGTTVAVDAPRGKVPAPRDLVRVSFTDASVASASVATDSHT